MKDSYGLFEKIATPIEGCFEIRSKVRGDTRGSFVKTFHVKAFNELELDTNFVESFYSTSIRNVIRGMHFQTPPADHVKLVYCAKGRVMDVVVDLRKKSPTFGEHITVELDSAAGNMLYIPRGLAHGFLTLSDEAIMIYNTTSVYSPENDKGIQWSSCGIDWKCDAPILSERDKKHPPLANFDSPF